MAGLAGSDKEVQLVVKEAWHAVTGDSYIVDVRKTYSARRLANYLSKYLAKGFKEREQLERLGFRRRYSSSRNWPKPKLLRLRGTEMERWIRIERTDHVLGILGRSLLAYSEKAYLMERVGDDLVVQLYGAVNQKRELKKLERWMYDKN